jgi:hypothetical protein
MDPYMEKDLESGKDHHHKGDGVQVEEAGAVRGETFDHGNGFRGKLMRLAGKYGIEQRGIERVPEDERTDTKHPYLNTATMVS